MKRREFAKNVVYGSIATQLGLSGISNLYGTIQSSNEEFYKEKSKEIPIRKFDVVVAGAGTAGVVAALAAANQGVKVALIEAKGYPGGTVVEGGTALHSFYNLWKAFPGVKKRMVVKGIPQKIIDNLAKIGATSGYPEMEIGFDYDSVCTSIDTELYKLVVFEMLSEAGVFICVNTLLTGAISKGGRIYGLITESRSGREAFMANSFVDCTAYGDLSAMAGAKFTIPNDYKVCNSFGMANVDLEKYYEYMNKHDAIRQLTKGIRSGLDDQVIRMGINSAKLPKEFVKEGNSAGLSLTTTTLHDNYFMFVKINYKMKGIPTNRDDIAIAELEIRQNQYKAVELFRKYIPGCEKAFIARTSPSLNIRRGRLIECDYDISHEDVINGVHFDDDVFVYGFHDSAPRLQVKNGGTYGIPYKALLVKDIENLFVSGMMITKDHRAHMSTRNTISCMGQGQATGTAAALCSQKMIGSRELKYSDLRKTLENDNVYFEA